MSDLKVACLCAKKQDGSDCEKLKCPRKVGGDLNKIPKDKNEELLWSFVGYCTEHPEERFWQALRNWSGQQFILFGHGEVGKWLCRDTFYLEGKIN